jgi:hypothetical protein
LFSRRAFKVVDALILATLLVGAGTSAILVLNILDSAPSVTVGQITGVAVQGKPVLQVPVMVQNGGPLTADDVSIKLRIADSSNNNTVVSGSLGPLSIPPGKSVKLNTTLTFDLLGLPADTVRSYLINDQSLIVSARITTALRPLIDVAGSANGTIAWGAPLQGLAFGGGSVSNWNSTFSLVTWTFSFKDDSHYFTVDATGSGTLSDSGVQVGVVRPFSMKALPGAQGGGTVTALVKTSVVAASGGPLTAHLVFHTSYGVDVPVSVVLGA